MAIGKTEERIHTIRAAEEEGRTRHRVYNGECGEGEGGWEEGRAD